MYVSACNWIVNLNSSFSCWKRNNLRQTTYENNLFNLISFTLTKIYFDFQAVDEEDEEEGGDVEEVRLSV